MLTEEPYKFSPGQVIIRPDIMKKFNLLTIVSCLSRHLSGDWGCVSNDGAKLNDEAVLNGQPLISNFSVSSGNFQIMTSGDRSETTICTLVP